MPFSIVDWWLNLTYLQQVWIFMGIPFILLFTDLIIKNGFELSIETAGGDLCLAAVGIDISQTFISISNFSESIKLLPMLLILAFIHLFLWALSLRLVSFRKSFSFPRIRIGTSYFFGLFAFCTSFGTIFQFLNQQRLTNG